MCSTDAVAGYVQCRALAANGRRDRVAWWAPSLAEWVSGAADSPPLFRDSARLLETRSWFHYFFAKTVILHINLTLPNFRNFNIPFEQCARSHRVFLHSPIFKKMWGNAFFIAQIVSFCRGIVRYSFPRPGNGSRIVPLLRFCVKKEISAETRPGPVASRRAPLAPDTVLGVKNIKITSQLAIEFSQELQVFLSEQSSCGV